MVGSDFKASKMALIKQELKRYMELFKSYRLQALKLRWESFSLTLRREEAHKEIQPLPRGAVESKVTPHVEQRVELQPVEANLYEVKAPLSGTFYRAPYPGAPPFVKVGDKVNQGDVLCIVEAMKVMNEITSPVSGYIREIVPQNGQPVKEGDVLFRIEVT